MHALPFALVALFAINCILRVLADVFGWRMGNRRAAEYRGEK